MTKLGGGIRRNVIIGHALGNIIVRQIAIHCSIAAPFVLEPIKDDQQTTSGTDDGTRPRLDNQSTVFVGIVALPIIEREVTGHVRCSGHFSIREGPIPRVIEDRTNIRYVGCLQ